MDKYCVIERTYNKDKTSYKDSVIMKNLTKEDAIERVAHLNSIFHGTSNEYKVQLHSEKETLFTKFRRAVQSVTIQKQIRDKMIF